MKIRHVYTVIREFEIEDNELKKEKEFFRGVQDESGEYLYSGTGGDEKIEVKMQKSVDGKRWFNVR